MRIKILIPLLILGAAVAAAMMFASKPEVQKSPSEMTALLVEVAEAHREPVVFSISSQGSVTARTRTTLVAEA